MKRPVQEDAAPEEAAGPEPGRSACGEPRWRAVSLVAKRLVTEAITKSFVENAPAARRGGTTQPKFFVHSDNGGAPDTFFAFKTQWAAMLQPDGSSRSYRLPADHPAVKAAIGGDIDAAALRLLAAGGVQHLRGGASQGFPTRGDPVRQGAVCSMNTTSYNAACGGICQMAYVREMLYVKAAKLAIELHLGCGVAPFVWAMTKY